MRPLRRDDAGSRRATVDTPGFICGKAQAHHIMSRDGYKNWDGIEVPLDPLGAVRPVRSSATPSGLPMGLKVFTPSAWKHR